MGSGYAQKRGIGGESFRSFDKAIDRRAAIHYFLFKPRIR